MHIPDGFVSGQVNLTTAVISGGGAAYALSRVSKLPVRRLPVLGVTAAFIFVAQMLNFPIAAGVSGHFLGGFLAAVLLGPWEALLILSVVLTIQSVMFGDGGLFALGTNVLNMGIVAPLTGLIVYGLLRRALGEGLWPRRASLGIAAMGSVVLASVAACVELSVTGLVDIRTFFPLMVGVHTVIGMGEAVITIFLLEAVSVSVPSLATRLRPTSGPTPARPVAWTVPALFGAAILATPFASKFPDGLNYLSEKLGFASSAQAATHAMMSSYRVPGIQNLGLGALVSAFIGAVIVLVVAWQGVHLLSLAFPRVGRGGKR